MNGEGSPVEMVGKRMRRVALLVAMCLLVPGVLGVAPGSVAGDGWDYVYGDPGPENFSRYQEVEISPTGGLFLAGFFSGSFEGFSAPGVYKRFVQYKSAGGVTQWTKLLPDGVEVASYTFIPYPPAIDIDGNGIAYVETCPTALAVCSLRSFDTGGNELGVLPALNFGKSRVALRDGGLARVNGSGYFSTPRTVEVLDAGLQPVWSYNWQSPTVRSTDDPVIAVGPDDSIWMVGSNPRPLPTLSSNLTMVKLDSQTGAELLTVKHFGLKLGSTSPTIPSQILMVNDQSVWVQTASDAGGLALQSFSVVDGSLRGRVNDTAPGVGDGWGTFSPTSEQRAVLSGGQRLLYIAGVGAGPYRLKLFGLDGDPSITYSLLLDQPLAGQAYAVDSDELGNYVIAGSTTESLVFGGQESVDGGRAEATFAVEKGFVALNGAGRIGLKVSPALPLRVKVTGRNGVPLSGVGAVSLNVTVTGPEAGGYVTVFPCGGRPDASSLNFVAGQTVPNAVIAPVSAQGEVCFYSNAKTHLIADVNGYFPAGSGFTPVSPVRVFDTRAGAAQGLRAVPKVKIGGSNELRVKLTDLPGYVPGAGVGAVSLNVTVTGPDADGYVTVYPCGGRPDASSLNYVANQTVPNAVIAPVSPDGEVCFYSTANVDLIADVNGYFPSASGFAPVSPVRVFDTRSGAAQGVRSVTKTKVGGANERRVRLADLPGLVPAAGVGAVSLNVTVTGPDADGYVTVYTCGGRPVVSSLNYVAGQTVPNAVIAPVSGSGEVCFYSDANVDLIADVNGYFPTGSGFVALAPVRRLDTR